MKAELYSKISKFSLWGFALLIIAVFVLFFVAGDTLILEQVSEATGEVTELPYPAFTELTMYLCYAMWSIAMTLVGVFWVISFVSNLVYNPLGVLKKVLFGALGVLAVCGLFLISPSKLDFVLYLQYALLGLAMLSIPAGLLITKIRSWLA